MRVLHSPPVQAAASSVHSAPAAAATAERCCCGFPSLPPGLRAARRRPLRLLLSPPPPPPLLLLPLLLPLPLLPLPLPIVVPVGDPRKPPPRLTGVEVGDGDPRIVMSRSMLSAAVAPVRLSRTSSTFDSGIQPSFPTAISAHTQPLSARLVIFKFAPCGRTARRACARRSLFERSPSGSPPPPPPPRHAPTPTHPPTTRSISPPTPVVGGVWVGRAASPRDARRISSSSTAPATAVPATASHA